MKRAGVGTAGYTIIETLIFLAISGVLFTIAAYFMSGQQRKNEFGTGVREFQSVLSDTLNDISTGFYSSTGNFSCQVVGAGPIEITAGSAEQGTNANCTYAGKAMQFHPQESGDETVEVYTLVGKRQTGTPLADVRTIAEAAPVILEQANITLKLPYGIKVKSVSYEESSATVPTGTLAFYTRYAGNAGSGGITGTQDIDMMPVPGTSLGQSKSVAKSNVVTALATAGAASSSPPKGIRICFESGGTNQHATILLGGGGRTTSTELIIDNGGC